METHLSNLEKLESTARNKGIELLLKVLNKIISHPNDDKYRDLNFNKVQSRLLDCDQCLSLLFSVGFKHSENRLKLNIKDCDIDTLKRLYHRLQRLVSNKEINIKPINPSNDNKEDIDISALADLINAGFSEQDAISAIKQSLTDASEPENVNMGRTKLNQWSCSKCTFLNRLDVLKCVMCNNPMLDEWCCSDCTFMNESKYSQCSICNNPKLVKEYTAKNCNGVISECDALNDLSLVMSDYMNMKQNEMNLDKIDIDLNLNNFLHLISEHVKDEEFESIYNKISGLNQKCNMLHCNIFNRNHRNRNANKSLSELSQLFGTNDLTHFVKMQILDKIHCHYAHCYDIGHRLTAKEKKEHHQINDVVQLLSTKHKKQKHRHRKLKFISTVIDDEKLDQQQMKMYDFGTLFSYEKMKNKYKSLKEELTSNETATISLTQFNGELKKAALHFHSVYCQKRLIPRNDAFDKEWKKLKVQHIEITLEHIFVILIYCNFDDFSFEFSKTYRAIHKNECGDSIIRRHLEFYFLGKYLKETVCRLGIDIKEGKVKRFYHGISKRFLFPMTDINIIKVPLSTSSEMAVAVNFAAGNGLIVEFARSNGWNYYFSASWCSDYGNEKEHLFVQNFGFLRFNNIIDAEGNEFKYILGAINLLNIFGHCSETFDERKEDATYDKINERKIQYNTAINLVRHKTKIKKLNDLHPYADKLMDQYCSGVITVNIEWKIAKSKYPQIYRLLSSGKYGKYRTINIGLLNVLYPKLLNVNIHNTPIYPLLFEDILNHFTVNTQSGIKMVRFCKVVEVQNVKDILTKYQKKFKDIWFSVKRDDDKYGNVNVGITDLKFIATARETFGDLKLLN
eukprot:462436_1